MFPSAGNCGSAGKAVTSLMRMLIGKPLVWLLIVVALLAGGNSVTSSYIVPTARDCTVVQAGRLSCDDTRAHGRNYFRKQTCCQDTLIPFVEEAFCVDLDNDIDFCGSCSLRCAENEDCCHGTCTNIYADMHNCGICGAQCHEDEFCKIIVDNEELDPVGFPSCSPRND